MKLSLDQVQPCRINPPQPKRAKGAWCHPSDSFSVIAQNALKIKLEIGTDDPSFRPDLFTLVSFSSHVRPLTYNVISKPLHGPKVS